jgi:hypothetical protein
LKEKVLKILPWVLYFSALDLGIGVAGAIDDDGTDRSKPCMPPKAPRFRQVGRRLFRQRVRPLPNQVAGTSPPIADTSPPIVGETSVAPSPIHELLPDWVARLLRQLSKNGTINEHTLVVWDVDDTLLKEGSDLMFSGPLLIHPDFPGFIQETQANGTTHIALTNGGARYRTRLVRDDEGNWTVASIVPVDFSVADSDERGENDCFIPFYLRARFKNTDRVTWEFLRIEGLKQVGISFENPFGESKFSKPRHVLGTLKEHNDPFCAPVLADGVIFSNFTGNHAHLHCHHRKGDILRLFLDECKKSNRVFSNVIFIDDTHACVKNVVEVMGAIDMHCIGIHILPSK